MSKKEIVLLKIIKWAQNNKIKTESIRYNPLN